MEIKEKQMDQKKIRMKIEIKNVLLIMLAAMVTSVGLWSFVSPGRFAPSGVDGIATMLQELSKRTLPITEIPIGYFSVVLNVPLLIAAWFVLKRRYVVYTLLYMGVLSLATALLQLVNFPVYAVASELERFLAAIVGGIAQGISGLTLRVGGSAGGVDVIACMIQKKRQSDNVERIISLLSYTIAIFSFFVWREINSVIYSFVAIFVCERMTAAVLRDSRKAIRFEIVVDKSNAEEIKNVIVYEMKRSATILDAKGIFLGEDKELIVCLVHYRQCSDFLIRITQYPYLFLSYSEVMGIRGNFDWTPNYERPEDVHMRKSRIERHKRKQDEGQ